VRVVDVDIVDVVLCFRGLMWLSHTRGVGWGRRKEAYQIRSARRLAGSIYFTYTSVAITRAGGRAGGRAMTRHTPPCENIQQRSLAARSISCFIVSIFSLKILCVHMCIYACKYARGRERAQATDNVPSRTIFRCVVFRRRMALSVLGSRPFSWSECGL